MPGKKPRCPMRGRRLGDYDITRKDIAGLLCALVHQPNAILDFFEMAQITFLAELECWDDLTRRRPQDAARIVEIAQRRGIQEKPEKRACPKPPPPTRLS